MVLNNGHWDFGVPQTSFSPAPAFFHFPPFYHLSPKLAARFEMLPHFAEGGGSSWSVSSQGRGTQVCELKGIPQPQENA